MWIQQHWKTQTTLPRSTMASKDFIFYFFINKHELISRKETSITKWLVFSHLFLCYCNQKQINSEMNLLHHLTLFRNIQAHKSKHRKHTVYFHVALTQYNFRNQISSSQCYSFIWFCIPFVAPENRDPAEIVTFVSMSNTHCSTAVCPTTPGTAQKIVRRTLSKEHALLLTTWNPRRQPACQIFCLHFPHCSQQ